MASSVMNEPFFCSLTTQAERVFSMSGSRALERLVGGGRGVSFGGAWFKYCSFFRRTFETVLLYLLVLISVMNLSHSIPSLHSKKICIELSL